MLNKFKRLGKEIVKQFAISFFLCCFIFVLIYIFFSTKINLAMSIANIITVAQNDSVSTNTQPIELDIVKKRLKSYPSYGDLWATLKISDISLELPIYHGDNLNILAAGVGHLAGSYFPGEGGSIILAAHNTIGFFRRLPELHEGSIITIEAKYGTFNYRVTSTNVINYKDEESLPIQSNDELLMLYTCYPVTALGLTTERFVVYAELVGD